MILGMIYNQIIHEHIPSGIRIHVAGVDFSKGEHFSHDFTQNVVTHLGIASHGARNSSGGTYLSAECNLFWL